MQLTIVAYAIMMMKYQQSVIRRSNVLLKLNYNIYNILYHDKNNTF